MAPLPVGQGSKEPARGGVLGVSSATSFFLEFPLVKLHGDPATATRYFPLVSGQDFTQDDGL